MRDGLLTPPLGIQLDWLEIVRSFFQYILDLELVDSPDTGFSSLSCPLAFWESSVLHVWPWHPRMANEEWKEKLVRPWALCHGSFLNLLSELNA